MNTTLILVRHGETALNRAQVFQGQVDEPLNELGWRQVREAAPGIAALRPEALYSSNLVRALATAAEVAALTGLEVRVDRRLGEIDCGSWEGRTFAEVSAEDPGYDRLRLSGADFRRSPTGETAAEVADRVEAALLDIVAAHPGQRVAIASHRLAIQVGIARLLGMPERCLDTMHNAHHAVVLHSDLCSRLVGYNLPAG